MSKRPLYLDLLLLAVVAVWGANFAVVKYSLAEVSPMAFNSLRFMLAIAVMWYLAIYRGSKIRIHKGDAWPLFGLGMLGNFFYQVAFIIGLEWSYSSNAAVMLGSGPVYVAILSHFLFKEKVTIAQLAGIITGFLGVLMLIFGKANFAFELKSGLGDLMLFLATVGWALYTLLNRNFLSRYKPLDLAVISMTSGGLSIVLVGLPWVWETDLLALSGEAWAGIVYSGALSIGVSYIIWNHGLSKVGAVRTTAFQNFVPMFGILFGFLLLDERLSWVQYLGSIFVISGVVMTRWRW